MSFTSGLTIGGAVDNPAIDYDAMGGGGPGQGVSVLSASSTGALARQSPMGGFLQHLSAGPAPFAVFPIDIACLATDTLAVSYAAGAVFPMTAFPTAGAGATFTVVGALIGPGTGTGSAVWAASGGATGTTSIILEAVPRNVDGSHPVIPILSIDDGWLATSGSWAKTITLDGTNAWGGAGMFSGFQVGDSFRVRQVGTGTNPYNSGSVVIRLFVIRLT